MPGRGRNEDKPGRVATPNDSERREGRFRPVGLEFLDVAIKDIKISVQIESHIGRRSSRSGKRCPDSGSIKYRDEAVITADIKLIKIRIESECCRSCKRGKNRGSAAAGRIFQDAVPRLGCHEKDIVLIESERLGIGCARAID